MIQLYRHRRTLAISFIVIVSIALIIWFMGEQGVEVTTIRFVYQDRVADLAAIVAVDKNLFEEEGLIVKASIFSSGPACSEALVSGAADFGTMGDTTGIIAVTKFPIKIVASHGGGELRHRIIARNESGIKEVSDLKGKTLAVKFGTSTYGGFLLFTEANNLSLNEINLIDMQPIDMPEAMSAGSVDAIVASEPTPSLIESRGWGYELATLGELGNNYPILFVVNTKFADENPDIVVKMLKALIKGAKYVVDYPDESAIICSRVSGLSSEIAKKAMSYHYYNLTLDQITIDSLNKTASFLKSIRIIDDTPNWSKAIDKGYLEEAYSRLGSISHSSSGAFTSILVQRRLIEWLREL